MGKVSKANFGAVGAAIATLVVTGMEWIGPEVTEDFTTALGVVVAGMLTWLSVYVAPPNE